MPMRQPNLQALIRLQRDDFIELEREVGACVNACICLRAHSILHANRDVVRVRGGSLAIHAHADSERAALQQRTKLKSEWYLLAPARR